MVKPKCSFEKYGWNRKIKKHILMDEWMDGALSMVVGEPTLVKPVRRNSSRWLKVLKLMEDKTDNGFTLFYLFRFYSVSRGAPRVRQATERFRGRTMQPTETHGSNYNNWPRMERMKRAIEGAQLWQALGVLRGAYQFSYMWIDWSIRCIFSELRWKGGYYRMLVILFAISIEVCLLSFLLFLLEMWSNGRDVILVWLIFSCYY